MNFRLGHDVYVRPHQTSRFTLADEWRRSSGDSFSTRYIHSLEEEPSRVLDDPLHDAEIIKHFHTGNEENESWELSQRAEETHCYFLPLLLYVTYHINEDPLLRVDGLLIEEKGTASVTVFGEIGCKGCKPLEYVEAGT